MATVTDAERYMRDVLAGRIPACKWIRLACARQRDDLKRWGRKRREDRPYWFDRAAATHALRWFDLCPQVEAEWYGQPFSLQAWQAFQIVVVFGWRRSEDGTRRFRIVYDEEARKNGKSSKLAAVGLYLLAADDEWTPYIYSAATTGDQARVVWNIARKMPAACEMLPEPMAGLLGEGLKAWANSISNERNGGLFAPLNAKALSLEGKHVHGGLLDELHAHRTREVYDVIRYGRGARRQPLIWIITTAGSDTGGVCYAERTYTCRVLEGQIRDETHAGFIYTLDEGDDYQDPAVWPKANPNLGISVKVQSLAEDVAKAKESASAEAEVKTKRFNVWVGAGVPWMPTEWWNACADPALRLEDFEGCAAWAMADLAAQVDLNALAVWVRDEDGTLRLFSRFWLPQETVHERTREGRAQFAGWQREGHLWVTEGHATDFRVIRDEVLRLRDLLDFRAVGYDDYQGLQFAQELEDEGLPVVKVPMNPKQLSEPMKAIYSDAKGRAFRHDGNPVMAWCMANVEAREDIKRNIYPRKPKDRVHGNIDGAVAAIAARSLLGTEEEAGGLELLDW